MFGLFKKKTVPLSELGITVDWHNHLLPGVDDGVEELAQSAQILKDMCSFGIKAVVHTPHFNPEIYPQNTEAIIKAAFERYLDDLSLSVRESMEIRLGGEYMVVNGFEKRNMNELLQIEPGTVLIEMSYFYPSSTMEETIFNIRMANLNPVIAHPERYLYFADNLDQFDRYFDMGARYQLNLMSLSGCYGSGSVRIMEYLLKKGMYSYVGSDTHTPQHFRHITGLEIPEKYFSMLKPICR